MPASHVLTTGRNFHNARARENGGCPNGMPRSDEAIMSDRFPLFWSAPAPDVETRADSLLAIRP
jgi:hypothetical protein